MERRLIEAAMSGNETILYELIHEDPLILHRVSLTSFGENPLHIAALCGNLDFTRAILSRKPGFLTKSDSSGRCPLHLACAEGHVEIVKELFQACPEVSEGRDQDGRTPLELAALNEHVEVLTYLIQENPGLATLTAEDSKETVLHLCVRYNAIKALKLLVDRWSKDEVVNSRDDEGNTLLHLAVIHQQTETVKYLLAKEGFDQNFGIALNKDGFTAVDVLNYCPRNFRSLEILEILMRAGIQKAKDLQNSPLRSSTKPTTLIQETSLTHWQEKFRGNVMVVAILIAGICFQAVLNPPKGVWQDSSNRHQVETLFFAFNTSSFLLSLITIIYLMTSLTITKFCAYTMMFFAGGAVGFLTMAYMTALTILASRSTGKYLIPLVAWLSLHFLITIFQWVVYVVRPRVLRFVTGSCLGRTKNEVETANSQTV